MTSRRPARIAVVIGLLLGVVGCAGGRGGAEPVGAPYIRGAVASVTHHATATGLLVRSGSGAADPCGLQAVADAGTRYWRRTGEGALRPAALADVAEGDTVEVYVAGPVRESCPAQGDASDVVLLSRGGEGGGGA